MTYNNLIPGLITAAPYARDIHPKEKSLGKLSNRFIQYFLVGNTNVSLAHAATQVLNLQYERNKNI